MEQYVKKSEVKPWRNKFHNWMEAIHDNIKDEGISFTYRLVGSAKRNLVIPHHNKGFDCDYQIVITNNVNSLSAKAIKKLFIDEFDKFVGDENFKHCEDSTSSIEIKKIYEEESKIIFKYDVVILIEEEQTKILRYNKNKKYEEYVFEPLPDMTDAIERYKQIHGNDMWNYLRDCYYNKKTKNADTNKKSFQLLNEAVMETLQYFKIV